MVLGTSAHAIFQNGYINETGAGPTDGGIVMQLTSNVDFLNVTIEVTNFGIGFTQLIDCSFRSIVINNASVGISCEGSTNLVFDNIAINDTSDAIMLSNLLSGINNTDHRFSNVNIAGTLSQDVAIGSAENITIENCTINANIYHPTGFSLGAITGLNVLSTSVLGDTAVHFSCNDIENCTFDGIVTWRGAGSFGLDHVRSCNFTNIEILEDRAGNYTADGFYTWTGDILTGCVFENITMGNLTDRHIPGAGLELSGDVARCNFTNVVFYGDNAGGYAISSVNTANLEDLTFTGCTFSHARRAWNQNGNNISWIDNTFINTTLQMTHVTNMTVQDNLFQYENVLVESSTGRITGNNFTCANIAMTLNPCTGMAIDHNWFSNVTALLTYNASAQVFTRNYYRNYFDAHPNATTTNSSMVEFDLPYNVTGTVQDTHPLYYPAWFPRTDTIYVNLYSTFDYYGLGFDIIKLWVDGTLRVRRDVTITRVLYHLTVRDFAGNLLHDDVYNVNATPDLDLGLDVAAFTISNNFNSVAMFTYTVGAITVSVPVPAQGSVTLRLALGVFNYTVTSTTGVVLEDQDGNPYVDTVNVSASSGLSFGWVTVPTGGGGSSGGGSGGSDTNTYNNYTVSTQDYLYVFLIIGGMMAGGVVIAAVARGGQTGGRRRQTIPSWARS